MTDADGVVTLRLLFNSGRIDDALAVDEATMRTQVVLYEGVTFVYVGNDHRDGKWVRLFREAQVVAIRARPEPSPVVG